MGGPHGDSTSILAWRAELAAFLLRPQGGWSAVEAHTAAVEPQTAALESHTTAVEPLTPQNSTSASARGGPSDSGGGGRGGEAEGEGEGGGVLRQRVAALKQAVNWPLEESGGSRGEGGGRVGGVLALHIRRGDRGARYIYQ